MKKQELLKRIGQIKLEAEIGEVDPVWTLRLLDLLLDYVNDPDIRSNIEEVRM